MRNSVQPVITPAKISVSFDLFRLIAPAVQNMILNQ